MTVPEMHDRVRFLLDRVSSYQADTLLVNEVDMALNIAQEDYVKQRYNRANKYGKGFEENQKRIDDLNNLIITEEPRLRFATEIWPDPNTTIFVDNFSLPDFTSPGSLGFDDLQQPIEYMHMLNVEAIFFYKDCDERLIEGVDYVMSPNQNSFRIPGNGATPVIGGVDSNFPPTNLKQRRATGRYVQFDDLNTALKDPFNKTTNSSFLYNIGKGVFNGVTERALKLYTDDTFFPHHVKITYLKKPRAMEFFNAALEQDIPSELAEHTHAEICKAAVDVLLESISDPRYKTHQIETMKSD